MRQLALVLALALAACTGGSTEFLPEIDAPDGGDDIDAPDADIDAPPSFFIVVSPGDVDVTEGQVASFNVSLSAEPTQPVNVMIQSADTARVETSTQLTLTAANWSAQNPVTVTALGDDDAAPNDVLITLSAVGAMGDVTVTARVTDDDTLAIFADPTAIQVTEGLQGTVKVRLTAAPTEETTVAVALDPVLPGIASVSPPTLTFTAATWETEQDVIITADQDLDIAGATATLRLASATITGAAEVDVAILDDDQVLISPMPTTLGTIAEGGAPTGLSISLTRDPGQSVRVTITPAIAGKVSVNPGFVDFNSSNWNMLQTVQVQGSEDPDTRDDTLDLLLASTGLTTRNVPVTVDDNDTPTLEANGSQANVTEGSTVQLGVRLRFDPLGPVTVTAAIDNPSVATVMSGASLSFDSSDYNTYKMITIRGEQDQDLAIDSTFVTFQATSLGASLEVPINKAEDDQQVIETDMSTVMLSETGQATFGVRLRFRPNAGTAVSVGTGGNPHASVAPTSVPFNVGDYNTYKTVTVTGTRDPDLVPDTVPVTLSGASAPASVMVTATVTDVDMQTIVVTPNNVTVTEGPTGTGTFTVRLSHQPPGNVSVTIGTMNGAVATATPSTIPFTTTNYMNPVTVTVTGTDDADAMPGSTTITATIPGANPPVPGQNVAVNVTDDDAQGLQLSVSSMNLTEGQMNSTTLGVRLLRDPLGNVTVNAQSLDAGVIALVGTTSFVFNSSDYNQYKYVTLNAVQDPDLQPQNATIRFTSVSPMHTADATVTKPDEDQQAITTSVSSVTLLEGGTAQFGVRLDFQPLTDITVQVASADGNKATTSGNLTFTPTNYSDFQNVTVTGTQDNNLAQESVNVTLSSPGNVMNPRVVGATVNDDDQQQIIGVPANIAITEGNQTQFNVRLMFQPLTASVTVSLSTNPTGVVSTSGNLTFSNTNWMNNQQVTITATVDDDLGHENTTLTVSGASATAVTSSIAVTDNDVLTIVPSTTSLSVNENGTGSFTVALSNQPMNPVTVSLAVNPTGVANFSTMSIPFTTSNWGTPVTVNVTPVSDVDNQSESTTVTLSSGVTTSVAVGVTVNDTTVVNQPGWPTYFGSAANTGSATQRIAYQVQTGAGGTWTLDNLGVITGAGGTMMKMAIYTHNAATNAPDTLVASTTATSLVAGTNTLTPTAATLAPNTTYWIAFHVSASTSIGSGTGSVLRCTRATLSFGDSFPASWGTASCTMSTPINIFATLHL